MIRLNAKALAKLDTDAELMAAMDGDRSLEMLLYAYRQACHELFGDPLPAGPGPETCSS